MFRQSSVHMMYTVYTHITHHNTICNVYFYSIQYTYIIVSTHTHTPIYITHLQLDACPMFCATIDIMLSCAYNCIYTQLHMNVCPCIHYGITKPNLPKQLVLLQRLRHLLQVVLPELLNLVPACEDAAGQASASRFSTNWDILGSKPTINGDIMGVHHGEHIYTYIHIYMHTYVL